MLTIPGAIIFVHGEIFKVTVHTNTDMHTDMSSH